MYAKCARPRAQVTAYFPFFLLRELEQLCPLHQAVLAKVRDCLDAASNGGTLLEVC